MDPEGLRRFAASAPPGAPPLPVARTEGAYLFTPDGHRVLDAAGGAVVANIGHGRREVAEVYARAAAEATYVVPPFATESRVRLVERLQDRWLPEGLTRVVFTSGGSESMDAALRIARQHHLSAGRPSRWKVIGRDLSYHGVTLATASLAGLPPMQRPFDLPLPGFVQAPAPHPYEAGSELDPVAYGEWCLTETRSIVESAGPETFAAIFVEPVQAAGGVIVPPLQAQQDGSLSKTEFARWLIEWVDQVLCRR